MVIPTNPRVLSGRYELAHLVARGGMAEVYRAHDRLLDRPVALKVLFSELSVDRSFVERFRREAQAAANLSHPNIVPVFDWGEDDGTYFIVMEFVDGRPLSSILRTAGPLHPDRAAEIAADVALALAFAHRHGVVHRDVKPGNVLITDEGIVKVTDFGIARAINTDESLTQTGAVMGTATYFSPEQAEGVGVDARSDIYSLGVVLFEMVTGRPPFLGESPVSVASKHVREQPPTPREINPAVPPDLEAIILKCMAKNPEHRYATGDDLRVDLLRFREGRAVTAGPSTSFINHTESIPALAVDDEDERSRTGLYAGILAVLLIALAVVVLFLGQTLGWWHIHLTSNNHPGTTTTTSSSSTTTTSTTTAPAGQIQMPHLKGQTLNAAKQVLADSGFSTPNIAAEQCAGAANIVCDQSPEPNALVVPKNTTVTIFVNTPTVQTTDPVPPVQGEDVGTACAAIGQAGLSCAPASGYGHQADSTIPTGNVITTSPGPGVKLSPGTQVNLIISTGPPSVVVRNVVGQMVQQATSALTGQGLQVSAVPDDSDNKQKDCNVVTQQTPIAGDTTSPNATVTIIYGNGPACTSPPSSTTSTTKSSH